MKIIHAPVLAFLTMALSACSESPTNVDEGRATDELVSDGYEYPSSMAYTVLYADADGETHFREDSMPLALGQPFPELPPTASSAAETASNTKFALHKPGWGCDVKSPHAVTSRRYMTIVQGSVTLTTSDGETRSFKKGDILKALDVAGSKGHTICAGPEPLLFFFSNFNAPI